MIEIVLTCIRCKKVELFRHDYVFPVGILEVANALGSDIPVLLVSVLHDQRARTSSNCDSTIYLWLSF